MRLSFTKAGALVLGMLCFLEITRAQTVIWSEDFDGGMNGWSNINVDVDIDTARWFWEPTGFVGNGLAANDTLHIVSESWSNGAMVYNSDLIVTGGDGGDPPGNPPYPQFYSELVSPPIDLSTNTLPLSLQFDQLARVLNAHDNAPTDEGGVTVKTAVSWSIDGGVTWSTPVNVNPALANNENRPTIKTTIPLIGVTNESNFMIKFIYAMDFYFWVVDDIKLVQRMGSDMRANDNFYAIAPNAITPASQVEEFGFLCDIQNIGGQPETGVFLNVTITDDEGNVMYTEDKTYGTMGVDSLAENVLFGGFTPPAVVENYLAFYSVNSDGNDDDLDNNVIEWDFEVSENVFAKETGATTNITPVDDNSFAYGNCFYVPNGSGYVATDITFGVANADDVAGEFVTTKLIRWNGDENEDGEANEDEYEILAFNTYAFDGSENDELITIPFSFDGAQVPLQDDSYYIALVEYVDMIGEQIFFLASEDYDYAAMIFRTDSLEEPRYAAMLDVGLTGDLSTLGFGYNVVPTVRMTIGRNTSTVDLPEENIVKMYPNPASDMVTLELDLQDAASRVEVSIIDNQGRIMRTANLKNIQKEKYQMNLSGLSQGSHLLRVITDKGVRSLPFVKL